MKNYTQKIKLVKNSRGVWDLDPFKGCFYGIKYNKKGCYGLCYAAKIAKFRGYDFGKTIYRYFENENQIKNIGRKLQQTSFIEGIQPQFVRLGVMCDPSYDWGHTLDIINNIKKYNPYIVIITKHWTELKKEQLYKLQNLCINTSISALDSNSEIKYRLYWYNKLKKYCKSVLRVNTADFNDKKLKNVQDNLLKNENVIDNILRFPKNHHLVKNNIVNVKKCKFLTSNIYASISNQSTFLGYCDNCPAKCGLNL